MRKFDAIVIGLGAMGSAIAYQLASHGIKVLGLEKFGLNHTNGSSHGKTRIIRTAYIEHPSYVPLVQRAFELWFQLQAESRKNLIKITGGIMFGRPGSELVSGTINSARQHNLPYEVLSAREAASRFPVFEPDEDEVAVYEKNAGILFPEECVAAQAELAEKFGAELRFNEEITRWEASNDGVVVGTRNETYNANFAIFATGAWLTELVSELKLPLRCERQVPFWFRPKKDGASFTPGGMPIFIWQMKDGGYFYGIPNVGDGVKTAKHHGGEYTSPDQVRREVTDQDEAPVRHFLKKHIPLLDDSPLASTTCLYTNSPDEHFIIDFHPQHRNIVIVSPCSGHGFKFSSAIGEAVMEMVQDGRTKLDISLFKISRFS